MTVKNVFQMPNLDCNLDAIAAPYPAIESTPQLHLPHRVARSRTKGKQQRVKHERNSRSKAINESLWRFSVRQVSGKTTLIWVTMCRLLRMKLLFRKSLPKCMAREAPLLNTNSEISAASLVRNRRAAKWFVGRSDALYVKFGGERDPAGQDAFEAMLHGMRLPPPTPELMLNCTDIHSQAMQILACMYTLLHTREKMTNTYRRYRQFQVKPARVAPFHSIFLFLFRSSVDIGKMTHLLL